MHSIGQDIIYLSLSLFVGACIGAEREYKSKSAGLRTMIMVSMASCLFTILSLRIGTNNPDRLAANILTGLGFLGAGVIFKEENKVTGITTATTIWFTAAIGMAIGSGYIEMGLTAAVMMILVLVFFVKIQDKIDAFNQIRNYTIVTKFQDETLAKYEKKFAEFHLKSTRGSQTKNNQKIVGNWQVQGSIKNHEALINTLLQDPDIEQFTF